MIKNGLIILLFLLPVVAFAQYPNNPNKIRLGFQTTGNGLIYRGSGTPTLFPTGYNSAFQFYDTIANTLWVYQDSFWYLTNTIRRSTPPPYSSVSSGLTLVYGHGVWQDTDDYHRYEYVANDSIEAWVPATGTYYWPSEPSDIAATGSTGAVKYTAGLWHKVPTDSLFRYDGSDWVFIGAGGINYLNGDAGTVQDIQQGDTIKVLGGYGMNTSAGATDAVTVTADTAQLATPYDVSVVQDDINAHELADGDLSATNEIQQIDTLSLSGTTLSASLSSDGAAAKTVNLSPILSGYVTGSGTAGRVPRWTSSSALGDGVLRDDGTLLAIGGATVTGYSLYDYSTGGWRLATGTTAQRPTNVAGGHRYNTTLGYSETANGTVWLQSDFPAGTTRQTLRHNGTSWVASSFLENDEASKIINIIGTSHRFYISPVAFTDGLTMDASFAFIDNALANGGSLGLSSRTLWLRMLGIGLAGRGVLISGNGNSVVTNATLLTLNHNTDLNLQEWRQGSKVVARLSSLPNADGKFEVISESVGPTRGLSARQHNNDASASVIQFYKSRGTAAAQTVLSTGDAIGAFVFNGYTGSSYLSDVAYFGAAVTGTVSTSAMPTSIYFAPGSAANNTTPTILAHHTKKVGIGDFGAIGSLTEPARLLEIKGEARITDLTTDPPTRIVGADADGDLGSITVGSGLSLSAGTLTATGTGTMSSFTLAGSSGTPQTIENGNTLTIEAGYGMTTTAAATDKVTVAADTTKLATLYDVTAIGNTLYTGNGTIATDRTVTLAQDKTLVIQGTSNDIPGIAWHEDWGYSSDWAGWGYYRTIYSDDYFSIFTQNIQDYDSTVIVRLSSGDMAGDFYTGLQMDGAGNLSLTGYDDSGTSGGLNLHSNPTVGGYGARLQGGAGIEFDTDTGGKFVYQVNNSTKATLDGTGLGIGDTSPEKSLDVAGMGKFRQISGQDNTPSIGTNANMGTGRSASITSGHSSDVAGRISFTSGTTLTAGEWVTLTWGTAFDNAPAVVLMPENANGASIVPYLYVVPSTTGVSIVVNVTGVPYEGLVYEFNYIVIQGK